MKFRKYWIMLLPIALLAAIILAGCGGSDGKDGKSAYDIAVDNGYTGTEAEWLASLSAVPVEGEACAVCHQGAGDEHQASYDEAFNTDYTLTISSVESTAAGSSYDVTINFTIEENGVGVDDGDGLPSWPRTNFQVMKYDSVDSTFDSVISFSAGDVVSDGGGDYHVTATGQDYAPEATDSAAFIYICKDPLQSGPGHITLYNDVVSGGWSTGEAINYESPANVAGCERCHGAPYAKHGYRQAAVNGLADFAACKGCHYDSREGDHADWQQMGDNPVAWANGDAVNGTLYHYTANVESDVHLSHAMEFPYPQTMANCVMCHKDKLDMILTDENFTLETCKTCHPVTGDADYPVNAPALLSIVPTVGLDHRDFIDADYNATSACNGCHNAEGSGPVFSEIHTGYNTEIYSAENVKYSDSITVSIDSATWDPDNYDLTMVVSAHNSSDLTPAILIGLYGYGTQQMIVNGHDRWDSNDNGTISRSDGDEPKGEYVIGETTVAPNPYFTLDSGTVPGTTWTVTAHLSEWSDLIDNDVVRRIAIGVLPENSDEMALNAVTKVYDIGADTLADTEKIADADKCNACHDALGTTFHSASYGGDVNICKFCHIPLVGGSHLEMQSRSIDSYVHAIHSFQPFNYGSIDFNDPVEAARFALEEEFVYPVFTTKDCESCHVDGAFDVPDQSKSLPGVLSPSASNSTTDRAIGDVPEYVTGPASRACGGCHRAMLINEDDAGGLTSFNAHVAGNGYLVENDSSNTIFDAIVDKVMSFFD